MTLQWYAFRYKAHKGDIVHRQIKENGFEVYFPRFRANPKNPRARKVKPYFPGYLFVRADLEEHSYSFFQWMPHTIGLVSYGGVPAIVPENLVYAIQKRVQEINDAGGELFDGLRSGDKVMIDHGPFQGYEAIFDTRLSDSERVRVLLQLLDSRQVPVELPAVNIRQKHKIL